jgi:cobalt/nickel transport system ATP-binding protein
VTAPLIRLTAVRFAYAGRPPVLDGADLALLPGERLAVTGPNGAGKTTLLHLIVGLLKPQAGEISAFGAPRRTEADFRAVRARAGLVFQDPDDQLFCPTVAEDVAFGPLNLGKSAAEARTIASETLAGLGLAGFEARITHKLSGGEKRLVTLATVLAMRPDVLLLDEPTNALDEQAAERLVAILGGLPQAMVIVSHDRAFRRRLATRAVHLSGGRITDGDA